MRDVIYVGGAWADSSAQDTIDVINPATEETIDRVPAGTAADVDRAVAEARRALPGWEATPPAERAAHLRAILDALRARQADLATLIATDLGAPYQVALKVHVGTPIAVLTGILDILEAYDFDGRRCGNSLIVREPVGVVGAITPWNYPLHQVVAKVAPALAAGCTVVLKPSEVAPLAAYALADIIDEAGLPPGVFNLVSGLGPVVGEAIASHEGIDMVSFTGSTRAGKRVAALAAADGQAGRAGARRQVAEPHPGRRRPAARGQGRRREGLRQLRADLQRPHPDARPRQRSTTRRWRSPSRPRSATRRATRFAEGTRLGPLASRRPARPRTRLRRARRRGGRAAGHGRHRDRARPRLLRAARPSSPTSPRR